MPSTRGADIRIDRRASEQRPLLRGSLRLLLLSLAARGSTYGYAAVVQLRDAGLDEADEAAVYPALTRLERDGLLTSRLEASDRGAPRKSYMVTEAGRAALDDARSTWRAIDHLLGVLADNDQEQPDAAS